MASASSSFAQQHARSYRNLDSARRNAARKSGYSSSSTRAQISEIFRVRLGSAPHEWQLDVSEAILLGLDSVVIAGTGAGKTMPFMMPLLLDEKKKVVILSPLKVLQEDQAERFEKMQLSAAAVNGETWSPALQKNLKDGCYRGILTSPEMCLKHEPFRNILTSTSFKDICAVIVDEAHCIGQWGGDFRTAYSEIGKLRAFFPPHIPILATSATLTPLAVEEVRSQLGIDPQDSFYVNLGNDRPNIAYSMQKINSSNDYDSLIPLLTTEEKPSSADHLIKSIVFVNQVLSAQLTVRAIRATLPQHLHKYVHFLHAHRSRRARRRVMRRFRQGKVKILVATEAAGMGADIPDIEQVIQFGVPSSLSVWIQRAGRAGRSSDINARAILMVEKSMFQRKRVKRRKKQAAADDEGGDEPNEDEPGDGEDIIENEAPAGEQDDPGLYEWGKKVDKDLRKWVETEDCRRDVTDEYFANPPNRKCPTHACCDNCDGIPIDLDNWNGRTLRPSTPETQHSNTSTPHSTPSKSADENGKRKFINKTPSSSRRSDLFEDAQNALLAWRFHTKQARYNPSPVTAVALLPDPVLEILARRGARELVTVEDIRTKTRWIFSERHGEEVLQVLRRIDQAEKARKKAKKDATKAATAARKEAEKQEKEQEKEVARQEKAMARLKKAEEEKEAKEARAEARAAERARDKENKQLAKEASARQKRPLGCLTVNFGPSTPSPPIVGSSTTPFATPTGVLLDFQVTSSNENTAPTPRQRPRPRPLVRRPQNLNPQTNHPTSQMLPE